MKNRVITISREFGSGGRTIGRAVARKLDIPCYDSELIGKIAEESGLSREYIEEKGEHAQHGNWLANALSSERSYSGFSMQNYLWLAQQKVILQVAEKGPCVIVGRCADYILRDEADYLRVFIYADMEKRAERIVSVYGEQADSPEKRLRDKDKRRAAYYQYYTDTKWGKTQNYDITLNSGTIGLDRCAQIITSLY